MTQLDWVVLGVYLVAIVGFGVWSGRGNRSLDDFFLADRGMRWWAIGLSVMATQISAITFVSTTGQGYGDGMRFLVFYFPLPFAMVILCATLVPFFYRARVFTAYEYLERRFDGKTRTLTSVLFLASRGLAVGVTLYAPSLVLSVLLQWSETSTVLLMAGTTMAYVMYGGSKSVIWTDVVQMGIIWFGIFACIAAAIWNLPADVSVRDALAIGQAAGRTEVFDLSLDPTRPYTLWGGLIGGLFLMVSYFGTDQSQVQRYLSGASLTQSRLSLLFNAALKVPMQFLILLTGVLVFVFYHFQPPPMVWDPKGREQLVRGLGPEQHAALQSRYDAAFAARREAARVHADRRDDTSLAAYREAASGFDAVRKDTLAAVARVRQAGTYADTNYVFLTYVLSNLPAGITGLVIAVIFAAAMSTLSGEFNSLASASMIDVWKRFVDTSGNPQRDLLVSRLLTAFWGGFACVVAMQAGRLGSAIEVVNRFGSYFYGSILGVFMLAVLTPRATANGAFFGLFAGMGAVALVSTFTKVHFLWFNVVGALAVFGVGLIITAVWPRAADDLVDRR